MNKLSIGLLLCVLLLGACSSGGSSSDTVKIAVVGPLSGDLASWGVNVLAGVQLAVDEVNAQGGIQGKQVQIIAEDDRCVSEQGVKIFSKVIHIDQVDGVLGPACSPVAGPALPIAKETNVPTILTTASAPTLTFDRPSVFRVYPSDAFQGKAGAAFIFNELGKKKAAIVYDKNDWGEGLHNVFVPSFEALGGEVVYEGGIIPGQGDLRTELIKVIESGAEALYFPVFPSNAVDGFKQMGEIHFTLPVVGADTLDGQEVRDSGYANHVYYGLAKIAIPTDFETRLLAENPGLKVSIAAPLGYDAAQAMFVAMQQAGTDRQAVVQALDGLSIPGVSTSIISFDEQGDVEQVEFEMKVLNGREVTDYEG